MRPGAWRVGVWGAGKLLGVVGEVEVVGGQIARDPRLDPFHARRTGRTIVLRIVDDAGAPIPRGELRAHLGRGPERELAASTSFVNGQCALAIEVAPIELSVTAHGFLSLRALEVAEDRVLVMQRGPLVRFALTGSEPPAAPLRIELQLERVEPQFGVFSEQREIDLGPDGTGLFRTPFTGAGRVELWLVRDHKLGHDSAALGIERLVDIAATQEEQRIELPLTPAELAEALRLLDG
jgi:hypothetical protein